MPWKRTGSKEKKKNSGSLSDTEIDIDKRSKNRKEDYAEVVLPSTKPVKTKTSIATQKKTSTPQTDKKTTKTKVVKTSDEKPPKTSKPIEPKLPKKVVRATKSTDNVRSESATSTPSRTKKLSKKDKKEQSNLTTVSRKPTKEDTEVLTPIIDCKSLSKDELLSILRSANEVTPTCLKVNIINNYTPQKNKENTELIVRKGDIVYLQYVLDGNCLVKNKKGKSGFVPFSSTSSSLALVDSTPKTRRRLFGNKQQKKNSVDELEEKPIEKPVRKQRSISFDLPPENPPRKAAAVEPTDTVATRTESGSPTITKRAPVHYFAEGTSNEHKAFVASGRSKSYDQILKPISAAIGSKKKNRKEKDDFIAPLRQTKTRAASVNVSDEFDFQRPATALDRYRASSFDTVDPADLQRPATALGGRRLSNSSTSETSRGSIDRILSPITQRKLKDFSNSDRDMNKLKAFSRKITSKGSLKDKNTRKTSSSSRMSDSELSSSSYSSSIVKVNNKRNGSKTSLNKHKRTNSLSDHYQVNWYKDWNIEPSDSSDSEDESCNTTDTESIQLKVKKVTKTEDRSFSDYETRTGTNRLRYRRTSADISASSDVYVAKSKQIMLRETNNNERSTNLSGFAQVYKTKTAMQKTKSSSSDALLDGSNHRDHEMEQKIKELKKHRLSNSNSSLNSIQKNVKPMSHDNGNNQDELLSPLVPQKVTGDSQQSVSDILLGKSIQKNTSNDSIKKQTNFVDNVEKETTFVEKIERHNNSIDNVMIVKSDFIAQEENYVTILTCQHVTVLDPSDGEWWWIRNPSGKEGFVPKDFLMEKPKIPKRKPDASKVKRTSSPTENDLNNNSGILRKTTTTGNQQPTPLAKVAPLMRVDIPQQPQEDFSLYKKPISSQSDSPPLPSYNQYMMRRQKSDLTDRYYNNNGDYSDNEKIRRTADPGGAARVVRRRSFSGRQKKVRFANDVQSGDESSSGPRYQNSPGQILIVRQPTAGGTAHVEFAKDNETEVEIATWC
ncbi:nucleolar protein dao-5-like [Clytia hemisphaerica]|uniref:SH3 domain-containing protein n=1 Tax=Clytia hemisphaerica TaxID=252671 RepID=A0A7M5X9F4_9CNID